MRINKLSEFWPEWNIEKPIGSGAYGKVYKAVLNEAGLKSYSAIKVINIPPNEAEFDALRSEGLSESETREYFSDVVNDFKNEIKLMIELKGAPNIVSVEDYKILESEDDKGWEIFIRMELLNSFKDYLDTHTPTEDEVVKLGIDILTALEVCHKKHIIHRDIKPGNIFVDDYGNFKLGDFGIAKELEKTTGAVSSKGTYSYIAPEVAKLQRYNYTVDIYSLGIVMYTLLNNNRPPFAPPIESGKLTHGVRRRANETRLSGTRLPMPINSSQELANIILTACEFNPKDRFQTATAFKNALLYFQKNSKSQRTYPARSNIPSSSITNTTTNSYKSKSNTAKINKNKRLKILIAVILIIAISISSVLLVSFLRQDASPSQATSEKKSKNKEDSTDQDTTKSNYDKDNTINYHGFEYAVPFGYYYENGQYYTADGSVTDINEIISNAFISDQGTYENINWYFGNGLLIIDGTGKMPNFTWEDSSYYRIPWSIYMAETYEIVISDSITAIGANSFNDFQYIQSVVIPNSIISIENRAFYFCVSLKEVDIPDGVTYIGDYAFSYCNTLTSTEIPEGVEMIGEGAFYECRHLSLICTEGSYAEEYATQNTIPYVYRMD